jgi:hypothetical protein
MCTYVHVTCADSFLGLPWCNYMSVYIHTYKYAEEDYFLGIERAILILLLLYYNIMYGTALSCAQILVQCRNSCCFYTDHMCVRICFCICRLHTRPLKCVLLLRRALQETPCKLLFIDFHKTLPRDDVSLSLRFDTKHTNMNVHVMTALLLI